MSFLAEARFAFCDRLNINDFEIIHKSFTCKLKNNTGWPKSNVPKVRAYYSASDHLIRKTFAGVCRDNHWFEEYLKIIEIDDNFFE